VRTFDQQLFLVLVASLPIVRLLSLTVAGNVIPPADLLFLAAGAAWAVRIARERTWPVLSRHHVAILAYVGASFLAAVANGLPRFALVKLAGVAYLAGLAFLTSAMVDSPRMFRAAVAAWLVGTGIAVGVSVGGFVLFFLGMRDPAINIALGPFGSLPPGNYPRINGTFINPNMLCTYVMVSLLMLAASRRAGWFNPRLTRALTPATWLTAFATLSPGIGGVLLNAGLWRRFMDGSHRTWRSSIPLALGAMAAAVMVVSLAVVPAGAGIANETPSFGRGYLGFGPRWIVWQSAARNFAAHPIVGNGPGSDPADAHIVVASGRPQHLRDAHNLVLSIGAQLGVIGLAAFGALTAMLCHAAFRARRESAHAATFRFALGLAFANLVFYQGISGAFEDARHLWVLIGLIVAADAGAIERPVSAASMTVVDGGAAPL
jgi:putative inorganic carbon (hco3(-)) transporter